GAGWLAGCGAEAVAETMQARGLRPTVAPPVWQMRRAAFLAELGRRYLEAGGVDQLANLEPLYLRRSAAEERRESNLQEQVLILVVEPMELEDIPQVLEVD